MKLLQNENLSRRTNRVYIEDMLAAADTTCVEVY